MRRPPHYNGVMTSTTTAPSPVADGIRFLGKFLRSPREVASLWPSSRWLARAMVRDLDLGPGEAVLEFGPGTGPFTRAIHDAMRGRVDVAYLGIERDPEFAHLLRERFPGIDVCTGDVADLEAMLAQRPHLRPGAVVCGLPLVAMDPPMVDGLLRTIATRLPRGGFFRTFSYLHTMANPASWSLRRRMRGIFREFAVHGPCLRNLPPALIFEGRS